MRIVADESFDMPLIRALRAAGHEVFSILESHPGTDDAAVLALANWCSALAERTMESAGAAGRPG